MAEYRKLLTASAPTAGSQQDNSARANPGRMGSIAEITAFSIEYRLRFESKREFASSKAARGRRS